MSTRKISSVIPALAWLTTLVAFCAPDAARADSGFYETSFGDPADIGAWSISSGQWEVTNGRFIHGSIGSTEIATVHIYGAGMGAAPIMDGDFALDVYASIRSTAADARAGVVFNFSDPANYYVLLFSAAGQVQLNSVIGGVVTPIAAGSFSPLGVRKWSHIRLTRNNQTTTVRMDGKPVIENVRQEGLPDGQAGLVADRTTAQFDDFSVLRVDLMADSTLVNAPYVEDFGDHVADRWQPANGNWAVTQGEYRSTSAVQTAITVSEIPSIIRVTEQREWVYTVKTRMKNGYRGAGNLVGLITAYSSPEGYIELVFSPRGEWRFNSVNNGVASTFASGTYVGGGPNVWFDVEWVYMEREGNPTLGFLRVNGRSVFEALPLPHFMRSFGFVTHWALASFDDVGASQNVFQPVVEDFNGPTNIHEPNWEVRDGTLNGVGVSERQTLLLSSWRELMDIDYRVWLANHYGAVGNVVGLAYGFRSDPGLSAADSNYFEVVFTPTGIARLNRSLKGQTTTLATAPYQGGGAHRWFQVQLVQRQSYVTVKVNGVTVFDNVYQPDAEHGYLGVITHWAVASFDDISIQQAPR
jgi:hypothetical protein